jgi:5-methylcytosine-specific restriction endonuclease McrA
VSADDKAQRIAERDGGWRCHYCNQALAHPGQPGSCRSDWRGHWHPNGHCWPHKDHVIPRAAGGSNRLDNLVLACGPCNQAKHALSYLEFITGWRQVA